MSEFKNKVDVLDMIISVLQEHEKKLDEGVNKVLEAASLLEEHPRGGRTFSAKLRRHGGSLAITIPYNLVVLLKLTLGEELQVTVRRPRVDVVQDA